MSERTPAEYIELARCPGVDWNGLAENDSRALPSFLTEDSYQYLGSGPIPPERYTSSDYFRLELEKMWPNVWQFAAREEEMPSPGDIVLYENAGRSYLLIRQDDGSIRAFHNVCLHRGRKIKTQSGYAEELRCPFHGFTWKMDGTLKSIPCRWDFPHLHDEAMSLPSAEVDCWEGYVFLRENPGGPSLRDFLAPLPEHFKRWPHEKLYTSAWAAKVVKANWKATAEAFMEAFHVIATHPQLLPFTGDANSKYFVWGDHTNLTITPFGVMSPHLADEETRPQQWVIDQFLKYNGRVVPPGATITVAEDTTARQAMGDFNRKRYAAASGQNLDHACDAELQDALTYNVFPNFSPWGGFASNVVYRWRPWPDQDHTLMEVRILSRPSAGEPTPPSAEMTLLPDDVPWSSALGQLGAVLEQDMNNLPKVQAGMKASKTGALQLANYQEIRIRQFHNTLEKYLRK